MCPSVFDQLNLNSCTANSVCAMYEFVHMKEAAHSFIPSRLFLYYNLRKMENTVALNTGTSIRDAIQSFKSTGVCEESLWPYVVTKFADAPPPACYTNAKNELISTYARITATLPQLKLCLQGGHPVSFGIKVYDYWFSNPAVRSTGNIPAPTATSKYIGGHSMLLVGYDDSRKVFVVMNSWGPVWGDHGFCYIPYDYLLGTGLSWDFWTIYTTSPPPANAALVKTATATKSATPANTALVKTATATKSATPAKK
jgi:C1A family cysteine protease